jgi:signal transduction histidine kinase
MGAATVINRRHGESNEALELIVNEDNLRQARHDIRNLLNTIKLSCAVLQRRSGRDGMSQESLRDIESSADQINEIVSRLRAAEPVGVAE